MIYNLTSTINSVFFNIQQNKKIFRSYRLIKKTTKDSLLSNYFEFSTPTTNYTLYLLWKNSNKIFFDLLKNHKIISNGSGLYEYNSINKFSINLTDISPEHIGDIFLNYNGNITINAPKFLGGEFNIEIDRILNWKHVFIRLRADRAFFFFKQKYLFDFSYNIDQSFFNLTFIRNNNSLIQWIFNKNISNFNHLFIMNTSLLELNHNIKVIFNYLNFIKK